MMGTKHWLLAGALFLLGLVTWALFGSEILVVALALFLAFLAMAYIAAVGAQRAQAVEDEELRDL